VSEVLNIEFMKNKLKIMSVAIIFSSIISCAEEQIKEPEKVGANNGFISVSNKQLSKDPLPESAPTLLKSQRFSILFAGDILLANGVENSIKINSVEYPFIKIKDEFRKYDFIFANMESPITNRGEPFIYKDKKYIFRINPEDAACLKELKLDLVSIANNHILDYGIEGMEDTIAVLDGMNIRHTGGGRDITAARSPAKLRHGDTDIIILAYCERPPSEFYATKKSPGTAPKDLDIIKKDIAIYKQKNNIVIVSLHWGKEDTLEPQIYQVQQAHKIIDYGADAVIGHHPHWPQGIEIYHERPIIYSLGNFINGFINTTEWDNIAVVFYFFGNSLESIKVIPIAGRNSQIQFQPYVLTGEDAGIFLVLIQVLSLKLNTRMEVENNYGIINPNQIPTVVGRK
jgi:poly-gamma-glutamate capsule biosynthesis protein CapA/YwtB (metallophosphatase superfamily)